MRLKLLIAYKGTNFQGWQIQEKERPPATIQGELEGAISKITGRKIRIHGAGRTDSGVHALGQTAHLDLPETPKLANLDWRHSLNALLPQDIRILNAEIAAESFHARKDAIAKTYIYSYWTETGFTPPELADFAWSCGRLDIDAMRACFSAFMGEHDFSSFQNAGTPVESSVRKIFELKLEIIPQLEFYPPHAPLLRLSISANGFLKQMARNIAGFIWKAGKGKASAGEIADILKAADREALKAPAAPARGLRLAKVYYPPETPSFI